MGVPRFARYLIERYSKKGNKNDNISQHVFPSQALKQNIDWLCFDLNGEIHPVSQYVYRYGIYPMPMGKDPPKYVDGEWQKFFNAVSDRIDNMVRWVRPSKGLYISLDGSAPKAKQMQQRARRFRSAATSVPSPDRFNPHSLSAGTKLLFQLDMWLKWWIRTKLEMEWKGLTVHFSGSRVPGEGEHKISNWIRTNSEVLSDDQIMMLGLDADLFMLLLSQHSDNLWLVRDDEYSNESQYKQFKERRHLLVSLNKLRTSLKEDLLCPTMPRYMSEERVIDDFILMTFLVGNDFLPHSVLFEKLENGMNWMLDTYKAYLHSHRNSIDVGLTNGNKINWTQFYQYMEMLAKREQEFALVTASTQHDTFTNVTLQDCVYEGVVDLEQYKKAWYYKIKLDIEGSKRTLVARDYSVGLSWVYQYYSSGVPDWQYCYRHHYSPFISDVAKTAYRPAPFVKNMPTPPVLQLMCILPKSSLGLLQSVYAEECEQLPYPDPALIKIDYEGVWAEYQGVYLLPEADFEQFKRIYDDIQPGNRDKLDTESVMWYDKTIPTYKLKTSFGERDFKVISTGMSMYKDRKPQYMQVITKQAVPVQRTSHVVTTAVDTEQPVSIKPEKNTRQVITYQKKPQIATATTSSGGQTLVIKPRKVVHVNHDTVPVVTRAIAPVPRSVTTPSPQASVSRIQPPAVIRTGNGYGVSKNIAGRSVAHAYNPHPVSGSRGIAYTTSPVMK